MMPKGIFLHKPLSEETKRKISLALKGRIPKNLRLLQERIKEYRRKNGSPMKGKHHSEETKRKISESEKGKKGLRGIDSPHWKGDKVGYDALHDWVQRMLGTPQLCELCHTKTAKRYEWANKVLYVIKSMMTLVKKFGK